MRKRSVQEIIEVTTAGGTQITSSATRQQRIQQAADAEKKIADERNKAQKAKPSETQQKINIAKYQSRTDRIKANTRKQQAIDKAEADKKKQRSAEKETQSSTVTSRENLRKTIAGGKPSIQKTQGGNKSISDTGTVASNALKRGASLVRTAAAIPANIAKQKAKANLGKMQMADGEAPDKGTARQKIGYATRKSRERVNTAVTNTRRKAGRGIETVGKKLANEDYIHEAEKDSSKEVKKKTIDVMKGKNAVEVNPKIQAEETMSPTQKRKDTNLKKKYDDSDMKQNMIDQYGKEEGLKVYYATIRKQAMKTEAKEEGKFISNLAKSLIRNKRRFGDTGSTEPTGRTGQGTSSATTMTVQRGEEHKARRGVKKESVSGLEVQNVSDGIKFREYEFIDVIKNEPMKSPKNNIIWTEERDEYGDPINKDGSYAGKKNIDKNPKDEKITRSEAKMPVQGLVKLAAMVADNNKKRKNALQIQKYIGEDAKMGRMSDDDLAAAHKKFSGMDQTSPANSFMTKRIQKEINKRKKVNEETIIERSGKSNQNKRLENDPIVMKYISKNFDEKNRTKAVEQKAKEDAKKTPEQLKRERQMRNLMRGSSIGRKTPKPKK